MCMCPLGVISLERVAYQHGTLADYALLAYLLSKWERRCSYCTDVDVLQHIEYIRCRVKRVSNPYLACEPCNRAKGTRDVQEFLATQPERLARLLAQAKALLRDAAVNTTSRMLSRRLTGLGLPVEYGSGGLTKFNRTQRQLPEAHWIDAACVGKSPPGDHREEARQPTEMSHGRTWFLLLTVQRGEKDQRRAGRRSGAGHQPSLLHADSAR
jgi:hypothetical protein